jgi:hypothetical protein
MVEDISLRVVVDGFDDLPLEREDLICKVGQLAYLFILNGYLVRNNGYLIGFNGVCGFNSDMFI